MNADECGMYCITLGACLFYSPAAKCAGFEMSSQVQVLNWSVQAPFDLLRFLDLFDTKSPSFMTF